MRGTYLPSTHGRGHHGPLGPPLQQGNSQLWEGALREHGPSAPLVCPPLKSECVALKNWIVWMSVEERADSNPYWLGTEKLNTRVSLRSSNQWSSKFALDGIDKVVTFPIEFGSWQRIGSKLQSLNCQTPCCSGSQLVIDLPAGTWFSACNYIVCKGERMEQIIWMWFYG